MDDIWAILEKAGWPAGVIGAAALLMYLADKLHLWERPGRKSDRELLSADELTFRRDLLGRVAILESSLGKCEEKHSLAIGWMVGVIADLKRQGFTAFAPVPKDLADLAIRVGVAVEGK